MVFSSCTFLFLFLPAVLGIYACVDAKYRNFVLLAASLLFYGFGEPRYICIIGFVIIATYGGALLVEKYDGRMKKVLLALMICVDLSFLIYFKYTNFILENIAAVFQHKADFIHVVMPIGISFYTFQAISYLVDVYRKEVPAQKKLYDLALYIVLFPQLVAGPIVKYHDVIKELEKRDFIFDDLLAGTQRFILGLGKKVIIANSCGAIADAVFGTAVEQLGVGTAWLGAVAYSIQLYYDFSGYSDMAIGLGLMFGFRFKENFNYPYESRSITEFWRRWHISLSTWFKEYLYIPLGGNRVSKARNLLNLFIVFLVTGIWHGAAWTFVFWGLLHGAAILFEKITSWHKAGSTLIIRLVQRIYTLLIVIFAWVLFRADSLAYAKKFILKMLGLYHSGAATFSIFFKVNIWELAILVIAMIFSVSFLREKMQRFAEGKVAVYTLYNAYLLICFMLSAALIASSTYNPFLYFRF